ncbi:hypothetical protein ACFL2Z_05645 [Candidatus Eisenbacteria bacterium]|uniref:Peptidase M6-like domain-containing protein n=1 Tax=Eiseniibacteriota bacterium TaxID=2212470 RepID=A0ABV6YQZ1_UNCEI
MLRRFSLTFACIMIMILAVASLHGPASAGLRKTAYSGTYMWYSGKGMTGICTMSDVFSTLPAGATLTFMTWYDIQSHRDYGSVEVSTDGGVTWVALGGNITTSDDPYGNNHTGSGITGKSAGWISAVFDLSAYEGGDIILRFRYQTDATVFFPGWAIDDIGITGTGFFDDVEMGDGNWSHTGWNVVDDFLATRSQDKKIAMPPAKSKAVQYGP